MGIAINTPLTAASIRLGLDQSRYTIEGVPYSAALRQAIAELASRALTAVAGGFLIAGAVSTTSALGLIAWGMSTAPKRRAPLPPMMTLAVGVQPEAPIKPFDPTA